MSYPILQTKIITPRRHHDLLSRPRLFGMLDDLLEYRLTLISAPAGYGKTTLLVDLASRVEYPVCWLALDGYDHDPLRFVHYFVAAIRQQFPDFGGASRSLLENLELSDVGEEQVLQTIINDLFDHVQEHFALVLDDFHLVDTSPEINQFVNRFVQEMDENCHLVISTRSLLSLPDLPLMVGRSQVQGLSFEELAFLPGEIKDLYQLKYKQDINDQEVEQIANESEGWITGLLLTAETTQQGLTGQGRAARAAGVDLYDYLAQQVLAHQDPEMQDFLLHTSLLEEFNADLCIEAFGDPKGNYQWQDLIQRLLRMNLFIQPVDLGGTWLRYHHLFRDFLKQQFHAQQPGEEKALRTKLVDIYRKRGWYEKAYTVSRKLGDSQQTAEFLESISSQLLHSGQISLLKSWLDDLSTALIEDNPGLLVYQAIIASSIGEAESGLRLIDRALERRTGREDPQITSQLLIRRAACHRLLGSFQSGLDDALQALEISKGDADDKFLEAEAEREIGLNQQRLGQSAGAVEHLERSLACYLELDDHKNAAIVQIGLGFMEMSQGAYAAARSFFKQAYQFWEELGNLYRLASLSNNLGVLDHLTGDYLGSFNYFNRALEYGRKSNNLRESAFTLASLADLALDLGAPSKAEEYLNESYAIAEEIGDSYLQIYLQLSMAALFRIRGDLKSARKHLKVVENRIRDHSSGAEKGRYHFEKGFLLLEEGHPDQARPEFQAARKIFENGNLPVEGCLALVQLVRISFLEGDLPDVERGLEPVREIIRSLGTIQPLVPAFSTQDDLLNFLEINLPNDPFLTDLARRVSEFQSILPGLLEKLAFDSPSADISRELFLDIQTMGRVIVKSRGELITTPEWTKQKTVRELFFYLLSYPEGASREEICLEFWPDSTPEQLKKQFKNALYRLRRAVGKDTILYHSPTRLYHFNRKLDYRYDVEEFYKCLELAEEERNPVRRLQLLRQAAELYQHPFAPSLEGIWSEPVRYRLALDYERIMLTIAEDQLSRDAADAALQTLEKLLVAVPGQEKAWRMAMRSFALKDDRSGIERIYQRCRQALAQELDAEPSTETLTLYQELMS